MSNEDFKYAFAINYALCINQGAHAKAVAVEAKATDDATACGRNHGMMTELLACVYVGDVYLDDRATQ